MTDRTTTYLTAILCALCVLFLVSVFANISHPLFWADESMTVMHGERVLTYGYPKVHDGRNVVYDLRHPDKRLGIDERTDAFIGGANWGQYYFAAAGIELAELTNDLYAKTAIIRTTFALAGLAGLLLLALLGRSFFATAPARMGFLSLFALIELLSVPLTLHLREARYYSLEVLLLSLTIYLYVRRRILGRSGWQDHAALFVPVLVLLYFTFSPAYFIVIAAIGLFEVLLAIQERGTFKDLLMNLLPLLASFVCVLPLMAFFRTAHIADELLKFNTQTNAISGMRMYLDNLATEWRYFAWSDLLLPALLVKLLLLVAGRGASPGAVLPGRGRVLAARFLTVLFVVYFFAIAKVPNALFTRYFIALQPVLAMVILLDASVLYTTLSLRAGGLRAARAVVLLLFSGSIVYTVAMNGGDMKGHIHELTHPFQGPLDHVIPFIKERYGDTRDLVIATNYEETSFMYYLDAKVVVGFVGNNLAEDARAIPDIIAYRRSWGNFGAVFNGFLERARYRRVSFPVVDFPVNNIPELNWGAPFRHRFAAEGSVTEPDRMELFLKEGNGPSGGGR